MFFLTLFLAALFEVAACLLAGFSVFGALTFLAGVGAAFLVAAATVFLAGVGAAFLVVALVAGVASTTFLANGHLAGVVPVERGVVVFLLLVAMTIPFIELIR